ncbi:hypothetical protein ASD28_14975 [Massilia sp. Root133]|uniref:ABC transporter ATP-binding protein n=1 Tax=Massilia cellulosiltytica TaxID=2683234 RepID=A0A7X3K6H3_9BURK|nr:MULTISPECIES: ABC transporter ATP-binding protein [Telluria group]KQX98396.1 hypothetical protein ASD28_14975 [Massilia sp. Root133]KQZ47081.1 hypothetical protein ASD92_24865 [Massilia sp. Root1485]MVW59447.1 ABC transporter ATP-binding protein [Telluria cellulosilytica]
MTADSAAADLAARRRFAAELWGVMRANRGRVAVSVVLLLAAKVATVAVPLLLKRIIDVFSQPTLPALLPWYLLVGYALLRFASTLFNEWRDLLFARVTLSTVSAYAGKTFARTRNCCGGAACMRGCGCCKKKTPGEPGV